MGKPRHSLTNMKIKIALLCLFLPCAAFAQGNVNVVNPANRPVQVAIVSNTATPTTTTVSRSTALEAGRVLKASAGSLVSLNVHSTAASIQFILIMNSATVPVDGAVSLLLPPIRIPANSDIMLEFNIPLAASTGISVSNSSTDTFTKTAGGANCIFSAQVQ